MNHYTSKTTVKAGLGFASVLTIVFIVLKLIGKISWSWIWVLSPLWINAILWLLIFVIIIVFLNHL